MLLTAYGPLPLGLCAVVQALLLDAKARRERFPESADYAAKVKWLFPFID